MLRKLLSIILSITLSIIFCFSSTFAKSDKLDIINDILEKEKKLKYIIRAL